jgi:hypothetical protein
LPFTSTRQFNARAIHDLPRVKPDRGGAVVIEGVLLICPH